MYYFANSCDGSFMLQSVSQIMMSFLISEMSYLRAIISFYDQACCFCFYVMPTAMWHYTSAPKPQGAHQLPQCFPFVQSAHGCMKYLDATDNHHDNNNRICDDAIAAITVLRYCDTAIHAPELGVLHPN